MAGVHAGKENLNTDAEGRLCDDEAETGGTWPQTQGHWQPQKLDEAGGSLSGASEGAGPCNTLISHFWLQTLRDYFRCFRPSSLWSFATVPQD